MTVKTGLLTAALVLLPMLASTETLRFQFAPGDKYHYSSQVEEIVSINGEMNNVAELLNRVAVEVVQERGDSWLFRGEVEVATAAQGYAGLFKSESETFPLEYWLGSRGEMQVAPQYFAPFQRGVPAFPDEPVEPGDSWRSTGQESHDLRRSFGVMQPIVIPLQVFATYRGDETRDGVRLAVIQINTVANADLRRLPAIAGIVPIRITGVADQLYYFNVESGRLHETEDHFEYIYLLSSGEFIEYEGTSSARVVFAEEMDRKKVEEEIREAIEEQGIPDTTVESDEEGVTITLQNIQFPPDSSYLLPIEQEKLNQIAEILRRYGDRDLLITGHTALAGTAEGRQELSERRAAVVGNYLLQLGVRDRTQMFFRGVGAADPVADNNSEAGRRQNRRVEIKLLEN